MPFIKTKVSCGLTADQEKSLKERFGKAISLIPGKSEAYLLLEFESDAHLWLRGEHDAAIAYIEAAIFGNEDHVGFDAFTYEITKAFAEILGIRPDRVYIKFEDIGVWGVGGMCIDRNMYRIEGIPGDGSVVPRFTKNETGANAPASFFQYTSGYLRGTIEPSPGIPRSFLKNKKDA